MILPRPEFWISCLCPAKKIQQVRGAYLLAEIGGAALSLSNSSLGKNQLLGGGIGRI